MNQNGQAQTTETPKGRRIEGRATDELLNQEMEAAIDMKPGQYPAILLKWSDQTFFLPSKFHKEGVQECMEAYFAVRNTAPEAENQVRILRLLTKPPKSSKLHPKSGLYQILKPLAAGDDSYWDSRRDNIAKGRKLKEFSGRSCFVVIEEGKNQFASITGVNLAPVGVQAPYPTIEEGEAALEALEDEETPEGAAAAAAAAAAGQKIPF